MVSGGTVAAQAGEAGRPGIVRLSTAASASGNALVRAAANAVVPGGGPIVVECVLNLAVLSTLAEDYDVAAGLLSGPIGAANPTSGVVLHTFGLVGVWGNWRLIAYAAGVATNIDTGIAATVGWRRLRIESNAEATSWTATVDGVAAAAPISTGLPAAGMGPAVGIAKFAGTTARTADLDYIHAYQSFTTSR